MYRQRTLFSNANLRLTPSLQTCHYLSFQGLYCIERLSILHIEAVRKLTGATVLSSFQANIDTNSFGSIAKIEPKVLHEKK